MNLRTETMLNGLGLCVRADVTRRDLSDVAPSDIASLFRSVGLLLFRNFDASIPEFKRFTESICQDFMTYEGGASARSIVDNDPTLMTVTEPSHRFGIPLHGEMYYAKERPQILWFFCVRPADEAGETTVADGATVYQALAADTRAFFETRGIRYVCRFPAGRWQSLFKTADLQVVADYCRRNDLHLHVDAEGALITEYRTRAVSNSKYNGARVFINNVFAMTQWEALGMNHRVVRMEDGRPIPEDILSELRRIEHRATREVSWRAGDVLMLDNTRLLHGRRAFTDARREIYVRLCGALRETNAVADTSA
jgi:alpha-ketoglutarate-dependent taurine dioxygenase